MFPLYSPFVPLISSLLGCQGAFDETRHDLVGDRIVAVLAESSPDGWTARAALLVDGKPWTDTDVPVTWSWVDIADDVWSMQPEDGLSGRHVTLSPPATTEPLLGLRVDFPSGHVARAVLRLDPKGPAATEWTPDTAAVLGWSADELATRDLSAESRASAKTEPTSSVPAGGVLRLSAPTDDRTLIRWMAQGTRGTFLEIDPHRTDWIAADVVLDKGEVDRIEPISDGVQTLVGLQLSPSGQHSLSAVEVHVGAAPTGVWLGPRWLPSAMPLDPGRHVVSLQADDDAPAGLRIDALWPGDGSAPPRCLTNGTFDPAQLFTGSCLRTELVGTPVTLEVTE